MTQEERNEQIIEMMSILSEPMRIKILLEIASCKELRGKDILERFSVTQPTMSHHMNILTTSGLVEVRKEGRCIWYSINKNNLAAVKDIIIQIADGRGVTAASSTRSKPVVRKPAVKKAAVKVDNLASLKKESSVPKPKQIIEVPDIEELKKNKKKKKDKNKNKVKDKDKSKDKDLKSEKKKNKDKKKKK